MRYGGLFPGIGGGVAFPGPIGGCSIIGGCGPTGRGCGGGTRFMIGSATIGVGGHVDVAAGRCDAPRRSFVVCIPALMQIGIDVGVGVGDGAFTVTAICGDVFPILSLTVMFALPLASAVTLNEPLPDELEPGLVTCAIFGLELLAENVPL